VVRRGGGATVAEEIGRQAIVAHEIHNFMRGQTDTGVRIVDGVLHVINRKLSSVTQGAEIIVETYQETLRFISSWISGNVDARRFPDANGQIKNGIRISSATDSLRKIYTFLKAFYPASLDIWMRGFIMDSLTAYADHTSCSEGIAERAFTALAGINEEIDAVLRMPVAIQSAKSFIAQCNFDQEYKKQWLVRKLIEAGITKSSTAVDAALAFRQLGTSHIQSLKLSPRHEASFVEQVNTFADLLEDFYDVMIKPFFEEKSRREKINEMIASEAGQQEPAAAAAAEMSPSGEEGAAAADDDNSDED